MAATRLFALDSIVAVALAAAVSLAVPATAWANDNADYPISARDEAVVPSPSNKPVPSRSVTTKILDAAPDTGPQVAVASPIPDREKALGAQPERVLKEIIGVASWYGPGFHGRRTANGERFNQNDLTAAHKTLPFNTRVRVTSLATGKSVIVKINDRGPYIRGRTIDLSAAAARTIDMQGRGVGKVKLEILDTPLEIAHAGGSRAADTREGAAAPRRVTTVIATE